MASIARIPITNIYMGGDYTGRLLVGPKQQPVNVILDTGSSALALDGHKYHPSTAAGGDQVTKLAQTDSYGDGSSWTGAVLKTSISAGEGASRVTVAAANVAVAYEESSNMFRGSDGILGLAANKITRGAKDGQIDWDALTAGWDATLGGHVHAVLHGPGW